jgi:hypothetical protein
MSNSKLQLMAKFWWCWFLSYSILSALALLKYQSNFLMVPARYFSDPWVPIVFYNIPLQIVLGLGALLVRDSWLPGATAISMLLGLAATLLVVVHLGTAVYFLVP